MNSFPSHKFKLYTGAQLEDMVLSIKELGILQPIILWKKSDEYIILSGHNRKAAGIIAGLKKSPVVIKENLTEEEAVLIVTETNLRQRSFADLSYSERAFCLSQHYEAIKQQGKRTDIINEIDKFLNPTTSYQLETKFRSDEKIGASYGLSHAQVARYVRIATIENSLMHLLDKEMISFMTAYTLSFIDNKENQDYIADFSKKNNYKITIKKLKPLENHMKIIFLQILELQIFYQKM